MDHTTPLDSPAMYYSSVSMHPLTDKADARRSAPSSTQRTPPPTAVTAYDNRKQTPR
ncbi:hypothetical protein [Streptomyces sp. NPDC001985]|uniref:hypothetical protein n=1 Tax=Streptomyces sp. NPDC001985 TaxID=3154406 RepID=UPI00331DCE57